MPSKRLKNHYIKAQATESFDGVWLDECPWLRRRTLIAAGAAPLISSVTAAIINSKNSAAAASPRRARYTTVQVPWPHAQWSVTAHRSSLVSLA
jgi:hypothetical protein